LQQFCQGFITFLQELLLPYRTGGERSARKSHLLLLLQLTIGVFMKIKAGHPKPSFRQFYQLLTFLFTGGLCLQKQKMRGLRPGRLFALPINAVPKKIFFRNRDWLVTHQFFYCFHLKPTILFLFVELKNSVLPINFPITSGIMEKFSKLGAHQSGFFFSFCSYFRV